MHERTSRTGLSLLTLPLLLLGCDAPPDVADANTFWPDSAAHVRDAGQPTPSNPPDASTGDAGTDASTFPDSGSDAGPPVPPTTSYVYAWGETVSTSREDVVRRALRTDAEPEVVTPAALVGAEYVHAAALSPDGRRLAVAASMEDEPARVWIGAPDGARGRVIALPEGQCCVTAMRFSPDGAHLALITEAGGVWADDELLVGRADGGTLRRVWSTPASRRVYEMVWRDERELAFIGDDGGSGYRPYLTDATRADTTRPLVPPDAVTDGRIVYAVNLRRGASGDLLFTSLHEDTYARRLFRYVADEARLERVPGAPDGVRGFSVPASGDGLVLWVERSFDTVDVFWLSSDGSLRRLDVLDDVLPSEYRLTRAGVALSASGERLLFAARLEEDRAIVVCAADGSAATVIYRIARGADEDAAESLHWSADGTHAVIRSDSYYEWGVYGTDALATPEQLVEETTIVGGAADGYVRGALVGAVP